MTVFRLKRSLRPILSKNTKPGRCRSPNLVCALSFHMPLLAQPGGASRDRTDDPLLAKQVLSQLSYGPVTKMVGLGGLEPPTSPLSGVRSNHLSYRPRPDHVVECRKLVRTPDGADSSCSKGGDPAAPSDTATLLRLHPSHESHRGKRPPCG
jgi:hypothetical protein